MFKLKNLRTARLGCYLQSEFEIPKEINFGEDLLYFIQSNTLLLREVCSLRNGWYCRHGRSVS